MKIHIGACFNRSKPFFVFFSNTSAIYTVFEGIFLFTLNAVSVLLLLQ